jgi:Xaa-Pro dipeptidase
VRGSGEIDTSYPTIPDEEYAARREAVLAGMDAAGIESLVIFYPARIAYLTGFHHVPTERPIVLLLGPEDYWGLVVPAVEKEHAESVPGIESVEVYFEYPGDRHPMHRVVEVLRSEGVDPRRVGADHDGVVPHWGYRGPRLSDLLEAQPVDAEMLVESLRRIKSGNELACIQFSCERACRAHRRMQDRIKPGLTEMECYQPALVESLGEMIHELPGWRPRGFDGTGLTAMFVGGRSTAMPHGFVQGHGIAAGDVLVSGASADVDGYLSELERTMIVGEPTPAQAEAFQAMLALQARAIEQLRPGAQVSDVELEVLKLARELGHEQDLRHHVGHSIGLEGHEAPFLDRGDDAICEEGMVFTVEPGIYVPALGGFRHSDTVCVTAEGSRVMTQYPSKLEELVIPA